MKVFKNTNQTFRKLIKACKWLKKRAKIHLNRQLEKKHTTKRLYQNQASQNKLKIKMKTS
jgi:hypothetical protein